MDNLLILVGEDHVANVDMEDGPTVTPYTWHLQKGRRGVLYATCNTAPFLMHLFILGEDRSTVVDHIDGNGLNNRKSNLRRITNQHNISRQPKTRGKHSQYKGVQFIKRLKSKPWRAEITVNYQRVFLGYFTTEVEAGQAYDDAATKAFGEFAGLNFPERLSTNG